jgi:hypothetical protein
LIETPTGRPVLLGAQPARLAGAEPEQAVAGVGGVEDPPVVSSPVVGLLAVGGERCERGSQGEQRDEHDAAPK